MRLGDLFGARGARRSRGPAAAAAPPAPQALFFVHIPKCAGSSFRQVLKRWYGRGALFLDTHDAEALAAAARRLERPPRAIAGHIPFGLDAGLPVRPCYVSLVRHPLERFVSAYKHARRTPGHPLHPPAARLDLEDFYEFSLQDPRARGRTVGVQCYFISRERSFEAARAAIDGHYGLVAPTERYAEFVETCAVYAGRPTVSAPARNVAAELPGLEEAIRRLGPRIAEDHVDDLRLYQDACAGFEARRSRFTAAKAA